MGDSREADIRIGDIERGQARAMLDIHLGHGRLDPAEHEDRVSRADAARTRRELETLFDDLPAPHPELWEATRPEHRIVPTGPARSARPARRAAPHHDEVVGVVAGLWVLTMLPVAIVLTIFTGAWWLFIVFVLGVVVIGGVAEGAKRTPPAG